MTHGLDVAQPMNFALFTSFALLSWTFNTSQSSTSFGSVTRFSKCTFRARTLPQSRLKSAWQPLDALDHRRLEWEAPELLVLLGLRWVLHEHLVADLHVPLPPEAVHHFRGPAACPGLVPKKEPPHAPVLRELRARPLGHLEAPMALPQIEAAKTTCFAVAAKVSIRCFVGVVCG